jgi:hypothetical protein
MDCMSKNEYGKPKAGDPSSLGVVDQSVFVLQFFEEGMTFRQLAERFTDETSLARSYFDFFRQMGWIEEDSKERRRLSSHTAMQHLHINDLSLH